MSKTVALYAYTSLPNPDALARQLDALRTYAHANAWAVDGRHTVVDEEAAGASLNRPGLAGLLVAAQQHAVDTVVVYDIGRLSRDLDEAAAIEAEFAAAGCALVYAAMSADDLTAARRQQTTGWLRQPIADAVTQELLLDKAGE